MRTSFTSSTSRVLNFKSALNPPNPLSKGEFQGNGQKSELKELSADSGNESIADYYSNSVREAAPYRGRFLPSVEMTDGGNSYFIMRRGAPKYGCLFLVSCWFFFEDPIAIQLM